MDQGEMVEADGQAVDPFLDGSRRKILVCEPSSGYVHTFVYDNRIDFWLESARYEAREKIKLFTGNTHRLHVSYARELMAQEAIKSKMDWALMIDDDMLVPRNMLERLLRAADATGADIVAPMCTQRLPPYNPVMYHFIEKKKDGGVSMVVDHLTDYEPGAVVYPDAVGFGVVLIRVAAMEKVKEPRFFSNTNMGEDIFFCYKSRMEAGAKIACDTSIKVGHLKYPGMATEFDFLRSAGKTELLKKHYAHIKGAGDDVGAVEALNV